MYSKDNRPLGFSFKIAKLSLKTQSTIAIPLKISISQKGINKKQMQIMVEICQNRPAGRNRFFWRPSVAQIKKCWTSES